MGDFLLGIIEGFYGKPWSWAARESTARWLPTAGLDTYLYAPKSDAHLRSRWREDWPAADYAALQSLAEACRQSGVRFGVGLSPVGTRDFSTNPADQGALEHKLARMAALNPAIVAILFDDIAGSGIDAVPQIAIADAAAHACPGARIVVCPSYYSHDPRLAEVFGPMPAGYLTDLGRGLDAAVDIFWTGQKVCSPSYTVSEFEQVADILKRPPVLWDNYPVNDGRLTSSFLYLAPFTQRPAGLRQALRGHLANPMNQPMLSRLPLATLAACYGHSVQPSVCDNPELLASLQADIPVFADTGLEQLDAAQRETLLQRYGRFRGEPQADEVLAWLAGEYRFDPACLTG